jgi:hypothetical protein
MYVMQEFRIIARHTLCRNKQYAETLYAGINSRHRASSYTNRVAAATYHAGIKVGTNVLCRNIDCAQTLLGLFGLYDGADRLSHNIANQLPTYNM